MIKTDKVKLEQELKERKDIIDLRIKNIEKQENTLREKVEMLRKSVLKRVK